MRKTKLTRERMVKPVKNRLSRWWIVGVIAIPFIIMAVLHIGVAISEHFGFTINVENVDTSTWFLFWGSYLAGAMTLAGVIITLRHERCIHQYEITLEYIKKENDGLGKAICDLNYFAPSILYQRFNGLKITSTGYDCIEIANIRQQLSEEMQKINVTKLGVSFFTDAYVIPGSCSACKNPCRIPTVLAEFQKTYDKVENRIFTLLQILDLYIDICNQNAIRRALITNCKQLNQIQQMQGLPPKYDDEAVNKYESGIIDVEPQQKEIIAALAEIAEYPQTEIPLLTALAREYIAEKQKNAYNRCFQNKEKS